MATNYHIVLELTDGRLVTSLTTWDEQDANKEYDRLRVACDIVKQPITVEDETFQPSEIAGIHYVSATAVS